MNLKNTPARAAISNFLMNSTFPVDAAQVMEFLHSKNLKTNKVTVYRNLEALYKKGIIDRFEFGEGKFRYELKKEHHHHLICNNCGAVEDVPGEYLSTLESKIKSRNDFLIKSHLLEFFGICKNCQK